MANRSLILSQYLSVNGDGTSTNIAIGDYSGAPVEFYIQPPANEVYRISRLMVSLEDFGALDADSYGNDITLTNGIHIAYANAFGTLSDLTASEPIKTNSDWSRVGFDVANLNFGIGNEHFIVRWSFFEHGLEGLRLEGNLDEKLIIALNDDFSGLVDHRFLAQGFIESIDR